MVCRRCGIEIENGNECADEAACLHRFWADQVEDLRDEALELRAALDVATAPPPVVATSRRSPLGMAFARGVVARWPSRPARGLTAPVWGVLLWLDACGGEPGRTEIATGLGMSLARAGRILDEAQSLGLVEVISAPRGRRWRLTVGGLRCVR